MSVVIGIIIRLAGIFGLSLSPFAAGAVMSAGALLGVGVIALSSSHAGYARAERACEAKALEVKLKTVTIERDSLTDRAERAEGRIREMAPIILKQQSENTQLSGEVKRLQSTKEGAKPDDKALMDDRCNVTGAGVKRLR